MWCELDCVVRTLLSAKVSSKRIRGISSWVTEAQIQAVAKLTTWHESA